MLKIAIVVDDWKLSIFERHLTQAGYEYEKGSGITDNTRLLNVKTENVEALAAVVQAANTEATRTGEHEDLT